MQLPAALRARNPQLAARTGAWVLGVVAVLNLGLVAYPGLALDQRMVMLACAVFFGTCGLAYHRVAAVLLDRRGAFVLTTLCGVVSTSGLMAYNGASTALAPIMTLLGLLWAGVCLRTGAAWLVGVAAVLSFTIAELLVDEPATAVVNSVFLAAAVLLQTTVLSRALDQQAALTKRLTDIASLDALTGLATRRAFDEAVDIALAGHAEQKGTALVLVDLDRFKTINDVHGHPVGDQALQHVSAILSGSVRARDSVVGRLGGDELPVLLAGCPVEVAERRARDLWQAVRDTPLVLADGTALPLTVSVGVAHAPPSGLCAGELYAAADGALYAAKRGGRDTVAVAG